MFLHSAYGKLKELENWHEDRTFVNKTKTRLKPHIQKKKKLPTKLWNKLTEYTKKAATVLIVESNSLSFSMANINVF